VPELLLTTTIAAAPNDCFLMALSVDAHMSSMGPSDERVVAGVRSGSMALGQSVTWQAKHFGLPFRMTSKITEYEQPTRFVDEQTSGPFASWWHEHRFEEHAGQTVMTDLVRYRSRPGRWDASSTASSSRDTCVASWCGATLGSRTTWRRGNPGPGVVINGSRVGA
jgi:ligand-binding SRPBCC domain-containing protein